MQENKTKEPIKKEIPFVVREAEKTVAAITKNEGGTKKKYNINEIKKWMRKHGKKVQIVPGHGRVEL